MVQKPQQSFSVPNRGTNVNSSRLARCVSSVLSTVQADTPADKTSKTTFSWDKTDRADCKDFTYQNLKDESKVKAPGSVQYSSTAAKLSRHRLTFLVPVQVYKGPAVCH